jgi:TPR repeat protein
MKQIYNICSPLRVCGILVSIFLQGCYTVPISSPSQLREEQIVVKQDCKQNKKYIEDLIDAEEEIKREIKEEQSISLAISTKSVLDQSTKASDKKVEAALHITSNAREVEKKFQQRQGRSLTKVIPNVSPQSPAKPNLQARGKEKISDLDTKRDIAKRKQTENQHPKQAELELEEQVDTDVFDASPRSSIETLPIELLEGIFSYIAFKEMLPVRGVNHFFYALTTGYNRVGVVGIQNKPDSRKLVDSWYVGTFVTFKSYKKFRKGVWNHETIPSFIFYQFMKTIADLPRVYWSCLPYTQVKGLLLNTNKLSSSQAAELGKYLVVGSKRSYKLAKMYENAIKEETLEFKKGVKKTLELYTKAAKRGYIKAQIRLGDLYVQDGPIQNLFKAIRWYLLSAKTGNKIAQYNLASMIQHGWGIKREDEFLIFKWYQAAAKQGHSQAQYKLGKLYKDRQTESDYHKAFIWFEKSGIKKANFEIGRMYEQGLLSEQPNYAEAIAWYKKAATKNYKKALSCLGRIYYRGLGLDRPDEEKAIEYFRKAA